MASLRPYIPSPAVLRALARPRPAACPFATPLLPSHTRAKSSKTAKVANAARVLRPKHPANDTDAVAGPRSGPADGAGSTTTAGSGEGTSGTSRTKRAGRRRRKQDEEDEKPPDGLYEFNADKVRRSTPAEEEYVAEALESGRLTIRYWDQYVDDDGNRVGELQLRESITDGKAWLADRRMREAVADDEIESDRLWFKEMLADPRLRHVHRDVKEMLDMLPSKEQVERVETEARQEVAAMQRAWAQTMLDDPEFAVAHKELREYQDVVELMFLDPIPQAAQDIAKRMAAALAKVPDDARLVQEMKQRRLRSAATRAARQQKIDDLKAAGKKVPANLFDDEPWEPETIEDLFNPPPGAFKPTPEELDDELWARDLEDHMEGKNLNYLLRLAKSMLETSPQTPKTKAIIADLDHALTTPDHVLNAQSAHELSSLGLDADILDREVDKAVSPEEAARLAKQEKFLDDFLADPHLDLKLQRLKDVLDKRAQHARPIPSAPDPRTLPASQLTTYRARLLEVDSSPDHQAALSRLHIAVPPPFSVHPSVRGLNTALKLAYCGASDDVRRVLWRAYYKARALPTVLANVPDDAWDIIYYSQAVDWVGNTNREVHLKIILDDLKSVGRWGPPTAVGELDVD